jgi:hypothetical protein
MSPTLNAVTYVCVVSNYNLPDLEACLARHPSDVVLVVSDHEQFEQAANRLEKQLCNALPGIRIHRPNLQPGALPLGGDDAIECQRWVQDVLLPYLQRPELTGKPRYLNFTGGTKTMVLSLVLAGGWDALDYKAHGQQRLQAMGLKPRSNHMLQLEALDALHIEDVAPSAVAELHNDHIDRIRPNPLLEHPNSLSLAQSIWAAQATQDPGLSSLFDVLEQVWSIQRHQHDYQQHRVRIDLPEHADTDALDAWLSKLDGLQNGVLRRDGDALEMPGNKCRKQERDFVSWINANWLEQLCYCWLLDAGLPQLAVSRNLKIGLDARHSGSQREADLVLHHRSQTRLIEVKAGLPAGHAPAELENQVSALGERFGKTRKALFVSPRLRQQLHNRNRWENFQLRCLANQVDLCDDRDTLVRFAGLR